MVGGRSLRCVVTLVVVTTTWSTMAPASAADPVIAAAGDIACASTTSNRLYGGRGRDRTVVNRGDRVRSAKRGVR
jgi:hypothetical protein